MKSLLSILLVLVSFSSNADSLYTGAWSEHFMGAKVEEGGAVLSVSNSTHNLLAYEHNNIIIGYFKNSYGTDTVVVGYKFNLLEVGDFKASVYTGVDYGYYSCGGIAAQDASHKVCLAVVPEISYTKYKLQPTILMLGGAVAFSLKWDI